MTDDDVADELAMCHTRAPRHTFTCLGLELHGSSTCSRRKKGGKCSAVRRLRFGGCGSSGA